MNASKYKCPACKKNYLPIEGYQECKCGNAFIDWQPHLVRMGYLEGREPAEMSQEDSDKLNEYMAELYVSKNAEVLAGFTAYCEQHPDERFWQALRNWAGVPFVLIGEELFGGKLEDTFYREGKDR